MGIRSKLLLPLIAGIITFILFVHFYWVYNYLDDEFRHYKEMQARLINSLKPGLIQNLISGDLAYLHTVLNQQMELQKGDWKQLIVYDHEGNRLYPLTEPTPTAGKYIFELHDNLHLNDMTFGHLLLVIDWKNEREEEIQRIYQLEKLLIIVFLIITFVSVSWQNHLIRQPLLRLKDAAKKLSEAEGSPQNHA